MIINDNNPYKNVFIFPSGKPFAVQQKPQLLDKVNSFNDYLVAVEFMIKNFNLSKKALKNNEEKTDTTN